MKFGIDLLKKALEVNKHPGVNSKMPFLSLVKQGMPYITSLDGGARPPVTIYWNINSVCNLHCKMCDVGNFNEDSNFYKNLRIDRKLHEISLEKFSGVVDEVAAFKTAISINGTEPLMYKPLGKAISYARSKGLDVAVTTGAYNLPERAQELADAGLTRLNVSIDGPSDLHNFIRGRKDVFERATKGIQLFRDAAEKQGLHPEVQVNCTIMSLNFSRLVDFYESVSALPIDKINFVNMSFVTDEMAQKHNLKWGKKYLATVNCLSDEVQPESVDVFVLNEQINALKKINDKRITFLLQTDLDSLTKYYKNTSEFMGSTPCMSTWFFAQVMANGEVIPFTRCYNVPLGNINDQSFSEIWNGEKAKSWRKELRKERRFPACARCDLVC